MIRKYFIEIKNRGFLIILSWLVLALVSYLNKETLLFLLIKPLISKNIDFYFISTNVVDVFNTYIDLVYFFSFQLTLIFSLYQLIVFLLPALYNSERYKIKTIAWVSLIFWLISLFVINTFTLPVCWDFFSSFQTSTNQYINIFFEAKITEYFSLYILVYYITSLTFQIFVIVFLTINLLDKKFEFIKTTRKIFYMLFILLATLVTPPDVISQLLTVSCFILVYESFIVITVLKKIFNLVTS